MVAKDAVTEGGRRHATKRGPRRHCCRGLRHGDRGCGGQRLRGGKSPTKWTVTDSHNVTRGKPKARTGRAAGQQLVRRRVGQQQCCALGANMTRQGSAQHTPPPPQASLTAAMASAEVAAASGKAPGGGGGTSPPVPVPWLCISLLLLGGCDALR